MNILNVITDVHARRRSAHKWDATYPLPAPARYVINSWLGALIGRRDTKPFFSFIKLTPFLTKLRPACPARPDSPQYRHQVFSFPPDCTKTLWNLSVLCVTHFAANLNNYQEYIL